MRESEPVPVEFLTECTKAFTETTSLNLNGFYVTALDESGTVKWENVHFTKLSGGNRYTSGVYWPSSGKLSFYAISRDYTMTIDGSRVLVCPSPDDGDVVSSRKLDAANGETTFLQFSHVFAALDAIVFTPADGCTINVTAISCRYISGGTYDISTCLWVYTGAPDTDAGIASPALDNSNLGILCVPGDCMISVSYDCTFCGHTESFTSSATVSLPAGRKSTVYGTLQNGSGAVSLSLIINPWDESYPIQYEL